LIGVLRVNDELGRRLIVILKSYPCSWGRCVFCPFAVEQSVNIRDIIETNNAVINEALARLAEEDVERVSVFNGSSFHELPLDTVLKLKPLAKGRILDIEERSEYVTEDALRGIVDLLKPEELVVRVGFEVWDEELREGYLRKGMPNSEVLRLAKLRRELRELGLPIKVYVYVLFGIKGIPEDKVMESVRRFKELFDGVIAVKYRRYFPNHPEEVSVSGELRKFLEESADLVDWGEGEEWEIGQAPARSSAEPAHY